MLTSRKRIWQDRLHNLKYYKSLKFALVDLTFGFVALFSNPYRVCRKFLQKRREPSIYAYGETPYATYERMAEICGIGPDDVWVELGAGRGKGCFWLAHFCGCKVVGVEWIGQFVRIAQVIQGLFKMKNVVFECKDIQKATLKGATVIYLYGLWPPLEISKGIKVITISEPLPGFQILKKFWVRYPWGRTQAFLQQKNPF